MSLLDLSVFAQRRRQLMAQLPADSIALVASANLQPRNSDVDYAFRQDSDFYYLTGFDEPEALLVLVPDEEGGKSVLFCRDRDVEMEIWHGRRAGPEGAVANYGFDEAFANEDLDDQLLMRMADKDAVYYALANETLDAHVSEWLSALRQKARAGISAPEKLVMLDSLLHEMRLFKSEDEAQLMRQAGEISAQAHIKAMQASAPGVMEYQLEAAITHHFMMNGCRQAAYPSIVGGGDNACILHYTENNQALNDGDLVLIDAGCELDYYAGDITRTFPVNGKFTQPQADIYQLVLDVQHACIEAIKPGVLWDDIHQVSVRGLTEGLVKLGLLKGDVSELIESGAYRDFYMHRIGHWLGMDVHDVGRYKVNGDWRPLEPGMVMTVEPGIYVSPTNMDVDEKWRGIGVRIEDDVLINEQGCEVLTASVPKEIKDIEALMAKA